MVVAWTEGVKRTGAKKLTVDCRLRQCVPTNLCIKWSQIQQDKNSTRQK